MRERFLTTLSLFTSSGTLICCALPALLVTLGFGGAFAGFLSNVPLLVELSRHKIWVFATSGILLGITGLMIYGGLRRQTAASEFCNTDTGTCEAAGRFTRLAFWISLSIYFVGLFMAYLYLPLRLYMEVL
jgi:mercuric ion transport protein